METVDGGAVKRTRGHVQDVRTWLGEGPVLGDSKAQLLSGPCPGGNKERKAPIHATLHFAFNFFFFFCLPCGTAGAAGDQI